MKKDILNILVIDDKSDIVKPWAKKIAKELGSGYKIFLISDRLKVEKEDNFEIININNIELKFKIEELQDRYNFSIYKLLVTDRAITNYTDFSKIQMYSNFDEEKIKNELIKWLNAYDFLFREKIDIVITGLADNFKFNMAWKIAEFYNKKFYIFYMLYWWNNGLLVADRYNQTSSIIDNNYTKFYKDNFSKDEKKRLIKVFSQKRFYANFTDNRIYPLAKRLKIVFNRKGTYEELSLKNLFFRKVYFYYSALIKYLYINKKYVSFNKDEKYILYPLHVAPEASILGSDPEIADQFCLIKNISMNLPYGIKLYVKEHPDQLYGYNLNHEFYNKLLSLPNVKIVKAKENIYNIISNKNCLAVSVIHGTVGLETVVKFQKPVFVFGNADYKIADCFIKPKDWNDFFNKIRDIQNGNWKFDEQAMWAIMKAFDESVVKVEEVDFSKFNTHKEYAMEIRPIIKFIRELNISLE